MRGSSKFCSVSVIPPGVLVQLPWRGDIAICVGCFFVGVDGVVLCFDTLAESQHVCYCGYCMFYMKKHFQMILYGKVIK